MDFAPKVALCLLVLAVPSAWGQHFSGTDSQAAASQSLAMQAEQLFALANRTRAANGLGQLEWDAALATAASDHCKRMTEEGPIAHRYGGEPDLADRAGHAGSHFSLIEENIAVGATAGRIHDGWMNSPDHRANLLNAEIDRAGIAVMAHDGLLFAVADYARAVQVLSREEVEAGFAAMLRGKGIAIAKDPTGARAYCASSGHFQGTDAPGFLIRWQNPDLTQLPDELVQKASSGEYRMAAVGSCPAQGVEGAFTIYRVAVLLYRGDSATRQRPLSRP